MNLLTILSVIGIIILFVGTGFCTIMCFIGIFIADSKEDMFFCIVMFILILIGLIACIDMIFLDFRILHFFEFILTLEW